MIIHKIESKTAQRKKRVAAYARVSTEAEEQQESLRTQIDYYTAFIQQNPMWEYVTVYADPGKSGTSAEHRPQFQQMIADAKAGKLDIILVKSISRFSRNIADAQNYVHELKAHEVEVRFEREAISSFDPASDMIFSVLAAVAQEESRSISENVKWSYRKHAEKGIRRIGNNRVLGYDEINGVLMPNKDAWIVKLIFEQYAVGKSIAYIVESLNKVGAVRLRCDKPFNVVIIQYILKNELYKGDHMLQKAAPHNYLTKKPDITQPYESYYVKDDHKAIVDNETWDKVQARLQVTQDERFDGVYKRENAHFLYGLVFCSKCGSPYTRRTVRGKGGMKKVWKCTERLKGRNGNGCKGEIIDERDLLKLLCERLNIEWTDSEPLDADAFIADVKRIDVTEKGIRILKKKVA